MKFSVFPALLSGALLFTGCSSTPTGVDTGKIPAATFSFVSRNPGSAPDFSDNREQIHSMIQSSITRNLAAKGVSRKASGGDITVAYLVIAGNNASTEAIDTYFGYGRDSSALHEKAHEAYTGSKNPGYFKTGTLLIDIIDAKTFKLLKRSFTARPILRNVPANVRAERIQEAVDATLKDVRIGR